MRYIYIITENIFFSAHFDLQKNYNLKHLKVESTDWKQDFDDFVIPHDKETLLTVRNAPYIISRVSSTYDLHLRFLHK